MKDYMMSSSEFSNFLDTSLKTYSAWEIGRSKPTLEKALEIANKLNKDVKEIWYL